jgi:hypothetical protein
MDYNHKRSVEKIMQVMGLKGLGTKMNLLVVNRQL